jgi:hypothetical protein
MPGKSSSTFPHIAPKRARVSQVYPAHHHTAHLIPDQLIPWLLAASLLLGLAILSLALNAHT